MERGLFFNPKPYFQEPFLAEGAKQTIEKAFMGGPPTKMGSQRARGKKVGEKEKERHRQICKDTGPQSQFIYCIIN